MTDAGDWELHWHLLVVHVRGVQSDVEVAFHAELLLVLGKLVEGAHLECARGHAHVAVLRFFECEFVLRIDEEVEIVLEVATRSGVLRSPATLRVVEGLRRTLCGCGETKLVQDAHGQRLRCGVALTSHLRL